MQKTLQMQRKILITVTINYTDKSIILINSTSLPFHVPQPWNMIMVLIRSVLSLDDHIVEQLQ